MPDPTPLSEATEEQAGKLLGTLEEPLRTRCRFAYVQAKIEVIQGRGESPSSSLLEKHGQLEARLKEMGLDPQAVTRRSKHRAER